MKLLLLVQNESDVSHLEAAAKAILNSAITGIWCVFSPAITVNAGEAAAKLDAEIAQLKAAESAAAQREDYQAASGYKTQREGKILDRAKVLRDAWKTAPAEARQARTKEIFKEFSDTIQSVGGFSLKITGHSDHYDREQWVAMLNSLSGVWFKPFTPGSFVIGWPESVETIIKSSVTFAQAEKINPPNVTTESLAGTRVNQTRREELESLHGMKRRMMAKELGIDLEGKSAEQIIDAILDRESAPVVKPEPVEAY